jgi:hypothetical protein
MSKKQKLNKFKHKQRKNKQQDIPKDQRLKNFVEPLAKSPSAAKALREALEKTVKG